MKCHASSSPSYMTQGTPPLPNATAVVPTTVRQTPGIVPSIPNHEFSAEIRVVCAFDQKRMFGTRSVSFGYLSRCALLTILLTDIDDDDGKGRLNLRGGGNNGKKWKKTTQ
jgi:hypothetical protein